MVYAPNEILLPQRHELRIQPGQGARGAHRDLQDEPAHHVLNALELLQGAPSEHPDLGTVKDPWNSTSFPELPGNQSHVQALLERLIME